MGALDPFSKVRKIVRPAQPCKQPVTSEDLRYKLTFELKSSDVAELEDVQIRCVKVGGSFEYEMEMPPNCSLSVNNGEPVAMITNPLISQRRKDAPISIKARLNQKSSL